MAGLVAVASSAASEAAVTAVGGEAGRAAGKALAHRLGTLTGWLRNRFRQDKQRERALEALDQVDADPKSPARVMELAEVLHSCLETDPAFAAQLLELVANVEADADIGRFVTLVRDNTRVGKLINIATIHGDVHF